MTEHTNMPSEHGKKSISQPPLTSSVSNKYFFKKRTWQDSSPRYTVVNLLYTKCTEYLTGQSLYICSYCCSHINEILMFTRQGIVV